jgi:virulence-associated protein VapD
MTPYELLKKLQDDLKLDVEQYEYTSPQGAIYFSPVKMKWAAILEARDGIRHLGFFPTRREAREEHKAAAEQFRGY